MRDILIRTDSWSSGNELGQWLASLGFHITAATNRKEFEARLKQRPELLLIDLSTKGLRPAQLCLALHEDPFTSEIPVILFGSAEQLAELDITAPFDDFLCLPGNKTEIQARIRRVLWRRNRTDAQDLVIVDDLVINLAKYEVTVGGQPVTLTLKEYELLRFLATRPGRVFSREYLLNQIWGLDYYGGMRTVDVHIRRLRAKLERGEQAFIETVRGAGYRFRS